MIKKEETHRICRDCGAEIDTNAKWHLCDECKKKRRQRRIEGAKKGAKIIGAGIVIIAGAIYVLGKRSNDSSNTENDIEDENKINDNKLMPIEESKPKYKVIINYGDGTSEEEDMIFSSREAAEDYGGYILGCCRDGAETLYMSNPGDYPLDENEDMDIEYEVIEVE